MTMTAFLSNISLVVSAAITWMNQFLTVIIETPALTVMCIAIPLVSISVDLIRRLIRI